MVKKIDDLEVYNEANELADKIWDIVSNWDFFAKDTIGKQIVKSADSIAANISEGYGRFFYKENLQFCYYGRGSLFETKTWIEKSYKRKLIPDDNYEELVKRVSSVQGKLNDTLNF
ncbi:MAG TPA: four helix bundle protein [Bacteroidales bacterium]|nr:four helix bundle protein [Bacteroidales bacterium]